MALYGYIKNSPGRSKLKAPRVRSPLERRLLGIFSVSLFFLGVAIIGQAVLPIAAWYLLTLPTYATGVASPLASNFRPENSPLFGAIVQASETISADSRPNSYKASTWFANTQTFEQKSDVITYHISIPKLKIDNAIIKINEEDLKKSLIGWPGSALPGTYGTNIVFGHSELPQFANPTDYKGIFTFLMDLENGDQVFIDFDGIRYKYEVVAKKVVSPTDLSVLEQRFDDSYVSLITCIPPGTLWMRGVVTARLTKV